MRVSLHWAFWLLLAVGGAQASQQASQTAYITNFNENTVSVVNYDTNSVVNTIPVVAGPQGLPLNPAGPSGVVINAEGTRLYVANQSNNTVSVIDLLAGKEIDVIPVGIKPLGVALNPAGTRLYVANEGSNAISTIDTATNQVVLTVPGAIGIAVGAAPRGLVVQPDGRYIYVANAGSNPGNNEPKVAGTISLVDVDNNLEILSIRLDVGPTGEGEGPEGITRTPDGSKVFFSSSLSGTISMIDTSINRILATIRVGKQPRGLAMHPDGSKVYVANSGSNTLSVVDTTTYAVLKTIPVGTNPRGVSVNPAGSRVYVANFGSNTVSVISTDTQTIIATVPVGKSPWAFGWFIGPMQPLQAPTFNPLGGTFEVPQAVTLSAPDPNAWIRYTTDGGTPSENNGTLLANGQFVTIDKSVTLKAVAVKDGWLASPVTEANYMIIPNNGGDGGGCAIGGAGGRTDPTLPVLAGLSLLYLWRRRRAVK